MGKLIPRSFLLFSLCSFWASAAANQASYVGSRTCFACHEKIYRSFTQTDMGCSMRPASELTPGVIPAEATVPIPSTNRILKVVHDTNGWRQSESESGIFRDEHPLEYVIGSGMNGLSFIVKRGDYLFQAPLSFYSRTREWHLSPGYEYADVGFNRPIANECIACHSGRAQPVAQRTGQYLDPPFRELAIGCENCHGPGSLHAQNPTGRGFIVNPGKLQPRLAEDICLNCHQGGDARIFQPGKGASDFRPGEWLIDTVAVLKIPPKLRDNKESDLLEHNSAMKASRCFRESKGKLGCLTCHDPHIQPAKEQAGQYYRTKCLICHTETSCPVPISARIRQAGADNCVACHMAKRPIGAISHSALTNHRIPARPDEQFPPMEETEIATDLVLVNQPRGRKITLSEISLLRAYGELANRSAVYQQHYLATLQTLAATQSQDTYVQAALGHKALAEERTEEAIEHLSLAVASGNTAALTDMAKALADSGRLSDAVGYLEKGVRQDPYNAVLRKTLTLDYIQLHRYSEATLQMQKYVEIFPEDSFMRGLLAQVEK
jgi:hypothetical protein